MKNALMIRDRDSFIATALITPLVVFFMFINYDTQVELREITTDRFNTAVVQVNERIDLVYNRVVEDAAKLSTSSYVQSFFLNRALGMSMEYGLRGSIKSIEKSLGQLIDHSHVGNHCLYKDIILYDSEGSPVTKISDNAIDSLVQKEIANGQIRKIKSVSSGNCLCVFAPVFLDKHPVGFLLAIVEYESLMYLFESVGSDKAVYGIEHNGYRYFVENAPTAQLTRSFIPNDGYDSTGNDYFNEKYLNLNDKVLFVSANKKSAFSIYIIESTKSLYGGASPIYGAIALFLFLLIIIFFSVRLFKWSVKNSLLEETLEQTNAGRKILNDQKDELEFVIDGADIGLWSWDISTGAIEINDQWATMLGYDKTMINPQLSSWVELIHPDDRDYVNQSIEAFTQGAVPTFTTHHRLRHKDGHWVWVRDFGRAFDADKSGRPLLAKGMHINTTELQEALHEARESRKEADSVIANFLDSLIVVDLSLNISRVNNATCDLLGYEQSELLGRPIGVIFTDSAETLRHYFSCPAGYHDNGNLPEQRNIELSLLCKDGSVRLVSVNFAVLRNQADEVVGVVAGAKDISTLKLALQETGQQKRFVESILNAIPGGILVVDKDHQVIQINSIYNQLVNCWANEHGFDIQSLNNDIKTNIKNMIQASRVGNFKLHSPLGDYIVIEYYSSLPADDPLLNQVVFLHDVTQRYISEATMKLHSTVLEQTGEAVVITSVVGDVLFVNSAAVAITGYASDEIIGRNIRLFFASSDEDDYHKILEVVSCGENWQGAVLQQKKNGTVFDSEVSVAPVRDEVGTIINYVFLWRDVTPQRLLQRQLLQAQKLEAVGQLASGIAHELNTPIQYIQNNVSFFKDAFADIQAVLEDVKKIIAQPWIPQDDAHFQALLADVNACDFDFILEEIPQSIDESLVGLGHIVKIVDAMKEFSHPGSGDNVSTDLNRIIENAIIVTKNEWKYVATLETILEPALPSISCDPGTLSQIFLNLIVNAAQAIQEKGKSESGLGKITLSTEKIAGGIQICVEDTGAGIPENIIEQIYEPFFTTKDVGKGTGQGLAIVYDLVVNKHNGQINCQSTCGVGTVFKIFLPIKTG